MRARLFGLWRDVIRAHICCRGLKSGCMHTRRVSRLSSKVTAHWRRPIYQGDGGGAKNNCKEIMYSFQRPTTIVLGWRARYRVLPFAWTVHFPGTFKTTEVIAIQYDRRCCVSSEEFEECYRPDRSRGESFRTPRDLVEVTSFIRYLLVSASPTFDPKKLDSIRSCNTWDSVIHRRFLTLASSEKTLVFSILLPKTYYPPRTNTPPRTLLFDCYRKKANY